MTGPRQTLAILLGSVGLLGSMAAPPVRAQMRVELVNDVGATAPCIGIGAGMMPVRKCATWEERDGFIRTGDVGVDGLTIVLVTPALLRRLQCESIADKELSALLARDQLIPIVHGTTYEDLRNVSPLLAS